ncbi:hypothetical protein NKI49_18645 [Mesorhizobium sp. M0587]
MLEEAQKETQCGDHQLGAAGRTGLGSPHDEPMNVAHSQAVKIRIVAAKLFVQESTNNRQIVRQCRCRETTLGAQEFPKCVDQLTLGARIDLWQRHRHAARVAQISYQLPNGPGIATPRAPTKFRQKSTCVLFPEQAQRNILPLHPSTETGQELNLLLNSRFGVSLAIEQPLSLAMVSQTLSRCTGPCRGAVDLSLTSVV